jgi:hypothetical protein
LEREFSLVMPAGSGLMAVMYWLDTSLK